MADEPAQASNDKQLLLEKIYIKDLSFESPKAPEIFNTGTQANTQLNISTKNVKLDEEHFEVSLTLTIESKGNNDTLFLIEIIQSGIFTLKGYSEPERQMLLGSFCPGTLYPFAREAVADIASRGGFPQLLLQPINFDAVYAQALQQRQAEAQAQVAPVQAPGQAPDLSPPAADMPSGDTGSRGGGEPH
jgi:preprotein translocase subunit SecB